jgi:hypothetical protein
MFFAGVSDSSISNDSNNFFCNKNTLVRREANRHFRNKKKAYLKAKIEDLETNSKIKNISDLYRGISDFKKGYQLRTTIVKEETDHLVPDSYSILGRWRKYFAQLLNMHGVDDVRQTVKHSRTSSA